MGKSSDQLREELDAQRANTGEKIDNLQHQVQDQIDNTRQQVTDTASHVRDEAQGMVTDTVDTVKKSMEDFDFEHFVQERPLASVGVAMLGGVLLGSLLGGSDGNNRQHSGPSYESGMVSSGGGSNGGGIGSSLRSAAQKSGLEDTISNAGAALMGTMTEQLKSMVNQNFPGFSEKLSNAQQQPGSFADKANSAQQEAQQQ